jgi:antitoxin MazE
LEVTMKVAKWGNSLAVRLPASLVESMRLKEGEEVDLVVTGRRSFEVKRKLSREEALRELEKFRGMMPEGFKFNREEANER